MMMSSLLLDGGQVSLQLGELGPLFRVILPAALHNFVYVFRATLRARHPVTFLHLLSGLLIGHPRIRTHPQTEGLPQEDAVTPHITL